MLKGLVGNCITMGREIWLRTFLSRPALSNCLLSFRLTTKVRCHGQEVPLILPLSLFIFRYFETTIAHAYTHAGLSREKEMGHIPHWLRQSHVCVHRRKIPSKGIFGCRILLKV